MDLDNNFYISFLEKSAYFMRNQYLICRPVRDAVKKILDNQKKRNKAQFLSIVGKMGDKNKN